MNKSKLTILAAMAAGAVALNAHADSRLGVTVGGNYNEVHFKQTDIIKLDKQMGVTAGVTGEYMIPGIGFGVDASLLYTMRGSKLYLGEKKIWSSQGIGNENCTLHYIDVPLNLKFKYRNLNGIENTIMPIVFAGPTFSFLAGHSKCGDALDYKTVSVGLHAGLGCELFNKVQVNASYNFSIGSSLRTKLLDENDAKNRTWTVTATYFF